MRCPQCNAELFNEAKYCSSCGKNVTNLRGSMEAWSKKLKHQTKQTMKKIKENLAKNIDGYVNDLKTGNDVKIAGVQVPNSKRSAVENALISFQQRWLADSYETSMEYKEWEAVLEKRLEDQVCIICFGKWKTNHDILVCPNCKSGGHRKHLQAWVKDHHFCPLCRQDLLPTEMVNITFDV